MKIKDVLNWIEQDIKYQKTLLQNDFQLDRPIRWRIIGMEDLKEKIWEQLKNLKGGKK